MLPITALEKGTVMSHEIDPTPTHRIAQARSRFFYEFATFFLQSLLLWSEEITDEPILEPCNLFGIGYLRPS